MVLPVCQYKVTDSELEIVEGYLVENLLVNTYFRCLAFNNHNRMGRSAVNEYVSPFTEFIVAELLFDGNQRGRIGFFTNKISCKILPYPFFRCKNDIFLSYFVKNILSARLRLYSERISW